MLQTCKNPGSSETPERPLEAFKKLWKIMKTEMEQLSEEHFLMTHLSLYSAATQLHILFAVSTQSDHDQSTVCKGALSVFVHQRSAA